MKSTLNLNVEYCHQTQKSVLKRCYTTAPYKFFSIPYEEINQQGFLYGMLMSSSPGVLGNDEFNIDIQLGENSALFFDTQAFNRILSMSKHQQGSQKMNIYCKNNTFFHYLPRPTVLQKNANYVQETNLYLEDDTKILLGEIVTTGRTGCNESYLFEYFFSKISIYFHDKKILEDKLNWQPGKMDLTQKGQMHHFSHLLSLYFFDTSVILKPLLIERLHELITPLSKQIEYGISQIHDNGMVIKAVAKNFQDLEIILKILSNFFINQNNNVF
ncbi:MAG: urease accessory protein UreD [Neisseriaceae bacterium]|nr:hypothetical protein [Neisseriaceae bacterium PsAf]MCV2508875.1 urease accessory protein UreD [Neisseriaceae bacterium]